MFRHDSSPLNHFTSADQNISRNSSQRNRNRNTRDGRVVEPSQSGGAKKIARKPASSSSASHWKLRNSPHTSMSDRYVVHATALHNIGTTPTIRRIDATMPAMQSVCANSS